LEKFKNYIEKNKDRFLDELFELLKIPSISAVSENKSDIRSAANLIREQL